MENLGVLSGVNVYPQPNPGLDTGITDGFALNLAGTKTSYRGGRKLIRVPNIKRVRRTPGQVTGKADATGVLPNNMDFRNYARILALHVGPDGYSRAGGRHFFRYLGKPSRFQVEKQHDDESPTIRLNRQRDNFSDMVDHKFSEDGAAMFDWTVGGSGERILDTPLSGPPTLADEDFVAVSYFDAFLKRNSTLETECSDFTFQLKNNLKRQGKIMTGRGIGTKYAGLPDVGGKMSVIFEDYDFLQSAIDGDDIPIECLWGSADPTVGSPFYARHRINTRFEESDEDVGGEDMVIQDQNWAACIPRSGGAFGAEIIVPLLGPFTVPASSHLGLKKDNGSTIDIPVAAGSKSSQDLVDAAMAVGAFTAVGTADLFAGHARFTLNATGSAHNWKVDTAFGGSIHALLGLDATVYPGYDAVEWVAEVMTDLLVDLVS